MIERVKLERFTAFEALELRPSPGINILIGENSTGKTHLLKVIYAACEVSQSQKHLGEKLQKIFMPHEERIGRLVKRCETSAIGTLEVTRRVSGHPTPLSVGLSLSNHTKSATSARLTGNSQLWQANPVRSVYIPVKDMMANAPGFRSLYNLRQIHFEEVYADIIDRAFLGVLRGPIDQGRKNLLSILQAAMEGKVTLKGEAFFLKNKQGELEFPLLAEGLRKLGLLWVLIQNGTLLNGSILLWDEPETNLNPTLMRVVVEILIALQRLGVQVFLATHNYSVLKEFDLQVAPSDQILYHSLYREGTTHEITVASFGRFEDVAPNAIDDAFGGLLDREIQKSMGGLGK